ncbi:MAG: tripartite tricarboxylate transporter substrate binding protein [Burkholderiales bacterium]|nr:tripartite tricarboxylate transporter substrate binding protein [Burkholderiales bacterium]
MIRCARVVVLIAALVAGAAAWAQSYPARPIRLIVPFPAGGTTDTLARPFARQVEAQLGRTVVIDNRSGANGLVGAELVANAAPDGYTMLWTTTSIVISQAINPRFPLDVFRDLDPLSLVASGAGYFVLVSPALGVKSIKELIALAKSRSNKPLTYGTPGVGNGQHIAGEMFNQMAGTNLLHVPYKGIPQQINALLSREIDVLFIPPTASIGFVKDGRVLPIAFAAPSRWPLMPDLPTVAEAGVPEFKPEPGWHGWFLPPKTPPEIVQRVSTEIRKAANSPKLRELFVGLGYTLVASTPEEFRTKLAAEHKRFVEVARAANIKIE